MLLEGRVVPVLPVPCSVVEPVVATPVVGAPVEVSSGDPVVEPTAVMVTGIDKVPKVSRSPSSLHPASSTNAASPIHPPHRLRVFMTPSLTATSRCEGGPPRDNAHGPPAGNDDIARQECLASRLRPPGAGDGGGRPVVPELFAAHRTVTIEAQASLRGGA